MRVHCDVDVTPEEARRLMGLPDLTPLHEKYLGMVSEAMDGRMLRPELIEGMMKSWAPMGEAGLAVFRRMFEMGRGGSGESG